MRALIVEDECITGDAWERALTSSGFECDRAAAVSDAMQHVLTGAHDLYLLDLIIRNGDTMGLTKLIKYRHPEKPVLMVTGSAMFPKAEHLHLSTIDWILRKPVPSADLEAIALYLTSTAAATERASPKAVMSAGAFR